MFGTLKSQVQILPLRPREVAQMVEHGIEDPGVGGSNPPFSAWVVARYEKHSGLGSEVRSQLTVNVPILL